MEEVKEEGLLGDVRDALYDEYAKKEGLIPDKDKQEAGVDTLKQTPKAPEDTGKEKSPEPKDDSKETEKDEPEDKSKKEDYQKSAEVKLKEKEQKLVPLDALHAEREKRKAVQSRQRELETQLQAVMAEVRILKEANKPLTGEVGDAEDIDPFEEVKKLRREMSELKSRDIQREQEGRKRDFETKSKALQNDLSKTNDDLEKEGYPGFNMMLNSVTEKLADLMNDDPQEAVLLDNPDGWKKIYKEEIYPIIKEKFGKALKEGSIREKEKLKSEANLIGSSGKTEKPVDKEDEDWTPEDYLNSRRKQGLL